MIGWLPIIGPILKGIFSIFTKRMELEEVKYKVDGKVDIAKVQAQTEILKIFEDNIAVNIARDLIMFPTCIWTMLVIWDKIVVLPYPHLVWGIADFTGTLEYLPYAVLAFLFGNAFLLRK
jgi:hypothetical protein